MSQEPCRQRHESLPISFVFVINCSGRSWRTSICNMGVSHHRERHNFHTRTKTILPFPCERNLNKALNHLTLSQMFLQKLRKRKWFKKKKGSSRVIRMWDEGKIKIKKGWQTCAINDQHLRCQEDVAIQALHRNQRHVRGRGLAALWVQPNVAWHFVPGKQNNHGLLKSSHSTREQLLADSILNRQEGLVNYCYAGIRFLNPSPLPAITVCNEPH